MHKEVNPKPFTVLALFTFAILASTVFIVLPAILSLASLAVASVELKLSPDNVSGDFSNIVFGSFLLNLSSLSYRHWIGASAFVLVSTFFFMSVTYVINKKSARKL